MANRTPTKQGKKKTGKPRRRHPAKSAPDSPAPSILTSSIPAVEIPREATAAHFSFFITNAQKAQLREKGYSDEEIAKMKPAEAHRILGLE